MPRGGQNSVHLSLLPCLCWQTVSVIGTPEGSEKTDVLVCRLDTGLLEAIHHSGYSLTLMSND